MKRKLGSIPLVYPIPIVLVGAYVGDRANFATVGDCAVMGIRPALVCISLAATHYTTRGVKARDAFSINIPTTALLDRVDYCGTVSGRDVDKSALFSVSRDEQLGVPMIDECPVGLACRVLDEIVIEHRTLFVAEVVEAYAEERFLPQAEASEQPPDMERIDPILYALDNGYYRAGPKIGRGYDAGREVKAPPTSPRSSSIR